MASPSESGPERRDSAESEQRVVMSAPQARQGAAGHNVRYVLGVGVGAIVVIFAIIWLVYFA